ncbi:MAG: hypothetical protein WCO22_00815 [Betaproteobacteria bacterium]
MTLALLYQAPLVVDIAIAFFTLETLALCVLHRQIGRGLAWRDYGLTGLSGLAHGADLDARWRMG